MAGTERRPVDSDAITVFLSYAREDHAFAARLAEALAPEHVEVRGDWLLERGENYKAQLELMIRSCDVFVFVISPESVASPACREEADLAASLGKRLVPVSIRSHGSDELVPAPLRDPQWAFFTSEERFDAEVKAISVSIRTDAKLAREHTELLLAAHVWLQRGRSRAYLLRKEALRTAEQWLLETGANAKRFPKPTQLQLDHILESQRNRQKESYVLLFGASAVAIVLAIATGVALVQRNSAVTNERIAVEQKRLAEEREHLASGRQLAAQALVQLDTYPEQSLLFAMLARRVSPDNDGTNSLIHALLATRGLHRIVHRGGEMVHSVVYANQGLIIYAGTTGGRVLRFDAKDGRALGAMNAHADSVHALAADAQSRYVASGATDGSLVLWDAPSGQRVRSLHDPFAKGGISSVGFSPDGRVLAAGRRSGEISIWNIETGQAAAKPLRADGVVQVAFLPDGRLVTASMDDAIRVWDWRKRITTASFPVRQSVGNWALAVDPLGKFIASTGKPGEVVVWRLGDRQTSRQVLVRSRGDVASLAFSRDGTYLAAGDERNIEVWRLDGPNRAAQPFAQFSGHTSVVQGLSFSPDGTHLLSGATDNTVRVWTLGSGGSIALQLHPKGGPEGQRVAFSADSSLVAGSSGDGTVRLWRLPDGTLVRSLKVPGIRPEALQFSPSGSLLVVGGRSTMRQPPTEGTFGAVATESGVLLGELQSRRNVVRSLRYSGDGSNLIVAEDGGGLSVWDAAGKQRFQELPPRGNGFTASITVSRDGRIIVPQSEKGVRIYRLPDLRLEGEALQDYKIGAVAVSDANSAFIAGASFGGDIHAWNLNTNQRLRIISGLRTNIYALGFSPSGSMFASAGNEGVWLWDWRSATRISHQLYSETLVQDVQFSPDGSYAAAASYNGSFWVWNLSIDRLEAIACRIANRDLSGEERELYAPSGVRDPLCERRDGDMVPAGIPRLSPKGSQHDRTFGRLSR